MIPIDSRVDAIEGQQNTNFTAEAVITAAPLLFGTATPTPDMQTP